MSLADYRKITIWDLERAAWKAAGCGKDPPRTMRARALAAIFVETVLVLHSTRRHGRDLLTMARDVVRLNQPQTITETAFRGWLEEETLRHDREVAKLTARFRRLERVEAYQPVVAAAKAWFDGLGPKVWFDVPARRRH